MLKQQLFIIRNLKKQKESGLKANKKRNFDRRI